jgi:hypothetical protein
LAVLFAVLLGIATKSMHQRPEIPDSEGGVLIGELREARPQEDEREVRRPPRTGKPGSKLRSLFDVRKGEIAALSVPSGIMKQLLIPQPLEAPDRANDVVHAGPDMVGVFSRETLLSALQPAEDSIRGVVDTSEDAFELKVSSMTISGSAFGIDRETRLQMRAASGTNSIDCLTRVSEGTCVLFSSGGENPEGVVIVTCPRGETHGEEK